MYSYDIAGHWSLVADRNYIFGNGQSVTKKKNGECVSFNEFSQIIHLNGGNESVRARCNQVVSIINQRDNNNSVL